MTIMEDTSTFIIINFVAYPGYNLKLKVLLRMIEFNKISWKAKYPKTANGERKSVALSKSKCCIKVVKSLHVCTGSYALS